MMILMLHILVISITVVDSTPFNGPLFSWPASPLLK